MAVAACNVNFVNVNMIAYRVHVYTCTSLIHSSNPNPDSSNRISPKCQQIATLIAAATRIAAVAHGSINLIRQVAPITPI